MKIAVTGKGGVGKTTLSAFLVRWFAGQGKSVLAIDADPDANMAHALGIKNASEIMPVARMRELIAERTESVPGTYGGFFKLNPKVDDLPEKLSVRQGETFGLWSWVESKKAEPAACVRRAFCSRIWFST